MDISKAKTILGKRAKNLSDSQVQYLMDLCKNLASFAIKESEKKFRIPLESPGLKLTYKNSYSGSNHENSHLS